MFWSRLPPTRKFGKRDRPMITFRPLSLAALLMAGPWMAGVAAAQSPRCTALAETLAPAWTARQTVSSPGKDLSMEDGVCAQGKLVEALKPTQGEVVGYKVGLTAKAVQDALGVSSPVGGVLLKGMILADGAKVPVAFGGRPLAEGDLIVTVHERINSATNRAEAFAGIEAVVPFIELPDLMVKPGEALSGPIVAAINVGARLGVVGTPVKVQQTPDYLQALADMKVTVSDQTGAELAAAPGSSILGHPVDALLWVVEDLRRQGKKLKTGDMVSLGTFGKQLPPVAGQTLTVRYNGLPTGPMQVSVSFQ